MAAALVDGSIAFEAAALLGPFHGETAEEFGAGLVAGITVAAVAAAIGTGIARAASGMGRGVASVWIGIGGWLCGRKFWLKLGLFVCIGRAIARPFTTGCCVGRLGPIGCWLAGRGRICAAFACG